MKIGEQCACGASFQIEDSDATATVSGIQDWRAGHTCPLGQPGKSVIGGTTVVGNGYLPPTAADRRRPNIYKVGF